MRRIGEMTTLHDRAKSYTEVGAVCLGIQEGDVRATPLYMVPRLMDAELQRPHEQWWMELRPVARMLAQPGPAYFRKMEAEGSNRQ